MWDSDESLLKSYALNRDEQAFRALSERYLGLIFHTALRRTDNRQLAEEISQNILCAVAKKASALAKNPDLLPAWLHRATVYESTSVMRSEISHQRRKQLLPPDAFVESNSKWTEAIPHLDQALDQLPESDRSVLLLHYFENRPFPKIAQALGKNPAAVQKQSQRALEKLSRILRSKGVTLSATVLATGLTSELAKAAPVALLNSATAAVLSGTTTYSTTGLMLMLATKSKALIPFSLLLCAVPLALQQVAISHARTRIGQHQTGPELRVASERGTTKITKRSDPNNLAAWKDLARRFVVMAYMKDKRIELELRERLDAMSADEILEKIDQIATWDLPIHTLRVTLLEAVIEKDPQKALRHFEDQLAEFEGKSAMQLRLVQAFGKWLKTDSSGATAWFDALLASGKLERQGLGIRTNEQSRDQMAAELSAVVIAMQLESGADLASQRFLALAPDQQAFVLQFGLTHKMNPGSEAGFVTFMRRVLPEDQYQNSLTEWPHYGIIAQRMFMEGNLEKVDGFLDSIDASPDERRVFATGAAGSVLYRLKGGEDGKPDRAIVDELREWLAVQAPQDVDRITGMALANINDGFRTTAPLVEAIHQETGSDGILIGYLENHSGGRHIPERTALAAKIKDDEKRGEIMAKLKP